jgi:hypothetical protein
MLRRIYAQVLDYKAMLHYYVFREIEWVST